MFSFKDFFRNRHLYLRQEMMKENTITCAAAAWVFFYHKWWDWQQRFLRALNPNSIQLQELFSLPWLGFPTRKKSSKDLKMSPSKEKQVWQLRAHTPQSDSCHIWLWVCCGNRCVFPCVPPLCSWLRLTADGTSGPFTSFELRGDRCKWLLKQHHVVFQPS